MNMDAFCQRFRFAWDMNRDLAFTISDVWALIKAVYLLPSTLLASALHRSDSLAAFLEINCSSGQGLGGAVLSFIVWLVIAVLAASALNR